MTNKALSEEIRTFVVNLTWCYPIPDRYRVFSYIFYETIGFIGFPIKRIKLKADKK